MSRPDFTPAEQYLVDSYRHPLGETAWKHTFNELYYAIPATILLLVGLKNDEPMMIIVGFAILLVHQIVQAVRGSKWAAVFHHIIRKYEDCLRSSNVPANPNPAE